MGRRNNPYVADAHTRRARQEGYPARSVYKLEEIEKKQTLLRPGGRVLDLGAAPGSWTSYAARRVGRTGKVLAIDLNPLALPPQANVRVVCGDAFGLDELLAEAGPFDVVLSDMAPRTTGSKVSDQARSFDLYCRALQVAAAHGRPGASFVGKLFMGPDFEQARAMTRQLYGNCRIVRPQATRQVSRELFIVGSNQLAGHTLARDGLDATRETPLADCQSPPGVEPAVRDSER